MRTDEDAIEHGKIFHLIIWHSLCILNILQVSNWEVAKKNIYVKCKSFQNDSIIMVQKDLSFHIHLLIHFLVLIHLLT